MNEAIAQGEEMKPFERVKHAVEALHARQVVHWKGVENQGEESKGGESDEAGLLHKERIDIPGNMISQHEKPRALGSTLSLVEEGEEQQSRKTQGKQLS